MFCRGVRPPAGGSFPELSRDVSVRGCPRAPVWNLPPSRAKSFTAPPVPGGSPQLFITCKCCILCLFFFGDPRMGRNLHSFTPFGEPPSPGEKPSSFGLAPSAVLLRCCNDAFFTSAVFTLFARSSVFFPSLCIDTFVLFF